MTHRSNTRFGIRARMPRPRGASWLIRLAVVGLLLAAAAAPAAAVCVGDCDSDGRVSIAEAQTCVNRAASLPAPPCAAADQNNDGTVDENEVDLCIQSFLDSSACAMVFTPAATVTHTATVGPSATPVPPTNTVVPTNTVPPTATPPPADTATPTPTPTIAEQTCQLAPNPGSRIEIHIAALPVPLSFGISGSIAFGASAPDASNNSAATCSIGTLAPVNITGIGFVCISAGSGCELGRRDCDGGTPLGIDVQSDGNAGQCTGNENCEDVCEAQCAGGSVLTAACTGYCTGTEPAGEVCTNDADCSGNGACNGPDSLAPSQRDLCQCTCVNTAAHGPSDPGEIQCNLGSTLVVEMGAPCGNGDVLIEVGTTCIPVTTQRATSLVSDANYSPGSVLPADPNVNDLSGNAVTCETLDGGSVSGLAGVGAVNFFGSSLGDLAVGLRATCQ